MNKACWKNKKVLVTGAEGFVGSYFFSELRNKGVHVVGSVLKKEKNSGVKGRIVKLDVLDKKRLNDVCKLEKINLIIHCAALDGNPEFKKNNSERIIDENVRMALNILNVAKENKIHELVMFSSAEIYAEIAKSPIKEGDDYKKIFPEINNGYVAAKVTIEILANLYSEQFGLKIMLPRPTNIYGPEDKLRNRSNRVIPSMIKNILLNNKVEIWGDGNQKRNFIYIDDFVKYIICLIEKNEFSVINISSAEEISIKALAKLIAKISKRKIALIFDKNKSVGVKKIWLDITKLNSLVNFKPLSLREGLKKTIEEGHILKS